MSRFLFNRQANPQPSRAEQKEALRQALRIGMPNKVGMWDLG